MQVQEIILKTRRGEPLSRAELTYLIDGFVKKTIPDYQVSAWLMAVYFQGLSDEETLTLTELMWKSGASLPRSDKKSSYWIDKHSTGGVGDKTSLLLVPIVTAVGERLFGKGRMKIPMISGRGLGHTGGTLDKLESVPGFSTRLSMQQALPLLEKNSFFMMGQTDDLAPADKRLYALRDCTGTVESLPLIVSSILSKKLCESLDGLVLDLKWGTGAFMDSEEKARKLGKVLVSVARHFGMDVYGQLTNMNEPLGTAIGHQVEVEECYQYLNKGARDAGLHEVVMELSAAMVHLASQGSLSLEDAKAACEEELDKSRVAELFRRMFEAQGGLFEDWERALGKVPPGIELSVLESPHDGYLKTVHPRALGELLGSLGGGRPTVDAVIDFWVGATVKKKVGDKLRKGEPVIVIQAPEHRLGSATIKKLDEMIEVSPVPVPATDWVGEVLR